MLLPLRFGPLSKGTGSFCCIVPILLCAFAATPALARQEKTQLSPPQRHVGEASEAVALVRAEIPSAKAEGQPEVRTASGVVIRCDGFVLVPTPLLTRMVGSSSERIVPVKNPRIQVSFAPPKGISGASSSGPTQKPPVYTATPAQFFAPDVPFMLIKVNDQHFPCLPLLHPESLREGQQVRVVFAAQAAEANGASRMISVSHPATLGPRIAGKPDCWTLAAELPPVPAGAVIVDARSGQALGMVAEAGSSGSDTGEKPSGSKPSEKAVGGGAGAALQIVSFARLHDITNVVGLRTVNSVAPGQTPGEEKDGMLWVPGGPIALSAVERLNLFDEAMAAGATSSACTPGFWIDRAEVTNEDYRQFLTSTNHPSLPVEWSPADLTPQPPLRWSKDLPVLGVKPEDAAAFARVKGKRLITPLEWAIAVQGEEGKAWLAEYMRQITDTNFAFRQERIKDAWLEAHLWGDYRWQADFANGLHTNSRNGNRWRNLPASRDNLFVHLFGYNNRNRSRGGRDGTPVLPFLDGTILLAPDPLTPQILARWTPYQAVTTELYTLLPRITPDFIRVRGDGANPKAYVTYKDALLVWQRFAQRPVTFGQESQDSHNRLGMPLIVAPAGSSTKGESMYHLRHGLTNVPELLQPNRANRSLEVAGKHILPLYHPDKQPDWLSDFTKEILERVGKYSVTMNGGNQFNMDNVWDYMNRHSINVWDAHNRRILRKNESVPQIDQNPANWLLPFPAATPRPDTTGLLLQSSLENIGFRCAR